MVAQNPKRLLVLFPPLTALNLAGVCDGQAWSYAGVGHQVLLRLTLPDLHYNRNGPITTVDSAIKRGGGSVSLLQRSLPFYVSR